MYKARFNSPSSSAPKYVYDIFSLHLFFLVGRLLVSGFIDFNLFKFYSCLVVKKNNLKQMFSPPL